MTAVFLGTVGLLALWDVADQWPFPPPEQAFGDLLSLRVPFDNHDFHLFGSAATPPPDDRTAPSLAICGIYLKAEMS